MAQILPGFYLGARMFGKKRAPLSLPAVNNISSYSQDCNTVHLLLVVRAGTRHRYARLSSEPRTVPQAGQTLARPRPEGTPHAPASRPPPPRGTPIPMRAGSWCRVPTSRRRDPCACLLPQQAVLYRLYRFRYAIPSRSRLVTVFEGGSVIVLAVRWFGARSGLSLLLFTLLYSVGGARSGGMFNSLMNILFGPFHSIISWT